MGESPSSKSKVAALAWVHFGCACRVAQKAKYQLFVLFIFLKRLICGGSNSISSGWKFETVAKVSPLRQDEKTLPTSFSLQEIYH